MITIINAMIVSRKIEDSSLFVNRFPIPLPCSPGVKYQSISHPPQITRKELQGSILLLDAEVSSGGIKKIESLTCFGPSFSHSPNPFKKNSLIMVSLFLHLSNFYSRKARFLSSLF